MKTTHAAPLGLRLFMEGIEVPCISAQVSINPGQPATSTIQIVPLDSAYNFLPRTLVHLFFLDDKSTDTELEEIKKAEDARRANDEERSREVNRITVSDNHYKLLFVGEVIGYNYNKSPSNRSLVLQCMDLSSYWDTCYQWFANYSAGGNAFTDKQHSFVGSGYGLFNNITSGHKWVIGQLLNTKPKNPSYANVKGLLGGLIHVMESIGGLRPARGKEGYRGSSRGVNDFFTIGELRYSITGMIGAVEGDTTSQKMYAGKAFMSWLRSGMSSLGNLVTYRDILRQIGGYVFHEVYPNPASRYLPNTTKDLVGNVSWTKSDAAGSIRKHLKDAKSSYKEILGELQTAIATRPPQTIHFAFLYQPFIDGNRQLVAALDKLEKLGKGHSASLGVLSGQPVAAKDAPVTYTKIQQALGHLKKYLVLLNNSAGPPIEGEQGVLFTLSGSQKAFRFIDDAIQQIDGALKSKSSGSKKVPYRAEVGARLYNQLILPETFFISPPRCNIIFPDRCFSFSFNRNFMREVSRLSMQGGMGIIGGISSGGGILGRYYYAPNIKNVKGDKNFSMGGHAKGVLLPHELHSGIIPKYEWVTDGHRWGMRARKGASRAAKKQKKISYIQRLANLKFFTHRWSARQMSAQLTFSPNLVLGFPAVIIDRATPSWGSMEALKEVSDLNANLLPTAFLGKVASLTHNLSQQGGVTSVVLSHCRTHRGMDDEFMDVLHQEKAKLKKETRVVSIKGILDELKKGKDEDGNPPKIDAVDLWIIQKYVDGTLYESQTGFGRSLTITEIGYSEPGPNKIALEDWPKLGVSVRDVLLSTFATGMQNPADPITVEFERQVGVGKFVGQNTQSVEDTLKPAWYSTVWDKKNLTEKVYQPLLGCSALTDDIQIASADSISDLLKQLFDVDTGWALQDANDKAVDVAVAGTDITVKYNGKEVKLDLAAENTIERSIDGLTMLYGVLKKQGLDTHRFITNYTHRPIATMPEILGTANLEFDDKGAVKEGSEGFHSRAFGDYNVDVKYLVEADAKITPKAGANAQKLFDSTGGVTLKGAGYQRDALGNKVFATGESALPAYMDPRGRARQRVKIYMAELRRSRALSGG